MKGKQGKKGKREREKKREKKGGRGDKEEISSLTSTILRAIRRFPGRIRARAANVVPLVRSADLVIQTDHIDAAARRDAG